MFGVLSISSGGVFLLFFYVQHEFRFVTVAKKKTKKYTEGEGERKLVKICELI